MSDEADDFHVESDPDLELGPEAITVLAVTDAGWRAMFAGLDLDARVRLLDGDYHVSVMTPNGVLRIRIEVPEHLVGEFVHQLP